MDLVEIMTAENQQEAGIIKSLLEAEGIECVFKSDVVEPLYNFSVGPLAEVRVYVHMDDAEKAREILKAYSKPVPGMDEHKL